MMHDNMTTWQWIFHGNIVIPLENPFCAASVEHNDDGPSTLWLGPGLKLCIDHLLVVDQDGMIVHLAYEEDISAYKNRTNFVRLSQHEFLCPGFIDLHIHAPQYAYTGTGMSASSNKPRLPMKILTFLS
jgi:cytosine/adenosine deaminase-related metal-dependent hydrolase